jgi:hypothetical protein
MTLGPQFEQLKMFMTPAEIKGYVTTSGDLKPGENMDQLWDRKLQESKQPRDTGHGGGVHEALSSGTPILNDVDVLFDHRRTLLTDKHHRVAAQADIDAATGKETLIPVRHHGDSGIPQPPKPPKKVEKRSYLPPKPMDTQERERLGKFIMDFL